MKKFKYGNSGRTYTFVSGRNKFTGLLGWRPVELSQVTGKQIAFDPVPPVMCVHDVMEHFPDQPYGAHNEYMAQGAMLWLRFEGGFFGERGEEITDVVKPAFGMLFHHIDQKKLTTKRYAENIPPMALGAEFALAEIVVEANRFIEEKYHDEKKRDRLKESLYRGTDWIHEGYNEAQRRYKGLKQEKLATLFAETADAISPPSSENGQLMRLTMDYENYSSRVELETRTEITIGKTKAIVNRNIFGLT